MYQVIDQTGQTFGPAPVETLRLWAIERRLTPDMIVVDQTTFRQGPASEMLLGLGVFLDPIPPGTDPEPIVINQVPIQQVSYAYKGSDEPGMAPTLQNRAVAFGIDFAFGMMLYLTFQYAIWNLFLPRGGWSTWSGYAYLDYLVDPLVMLFFLFRDAIFKGQSIGKRIAKLKVVTTNGKPYTPMNSLLRNMGAAPILLLPIPYVGYIAFAALTLAFCVDSFMLMTQGKRLGDQFAFTAVVNE